ncbi:Hsp20/alpha crystallin family protein [Ectobacillus sp. sgz5001026]|uniref:Hsp20/alpha crystallin family protein n=1 Tax=Ectobacillus sp. sgz5001026 TaxID=3242473 RepID=UPI0036D2E597
MCAKKNCFLQVEGFENWMHQFFLESTVMPIDLFETNQSYILEASIPTCYPTIFIKKTQFGLGIVFTTEYGGNIRRNILLPRHIMNKNMIAYYENKLLEIIISKTDCVLHDSNDILPITKKEE